MEFYEKRGHTVIPSASLLPENDPTTLFTSSGMQPLVPYLMGEMHPGGRRLADSQKCFRAGDIEEVGDNRHNTFFEMLGNWSLGDYFKAEQLPWFFEFLTRELGLDPRRLYVSVFCGNERIGVPRDHESVRIWQEIFKRAGLDCADIDRAEENGLRGGRIFYYDEAKNWWSRSGAPANMPVGEIGGPDSEVFYDLGAGLGKHENSSWRDKPCHPNCDCGRFIEIGNSVFIEFLKTADGFVPLPQKNVDFGGGLERLAMVVEGKDNVFETGLFINAIKAIEKMSGKNYRSDMKAFEVIADHLKGAVFIMGDDRGVAPSNVEGGYIVRRLIRRAIRYGRLLGISENAWISSVARIIIDDYEEIYPELAKNSRFILSNLETEEKKFAATVEKGEREFGKWANAVNSGKGKDKDMMAGAAAFKLFSTYGFPIEMTVEMAAEKGKAVDLEGFAAEMEKHQELSRTAAAGKFKGGLADGTDETKKLHTAAHLLLAALRRVLGPEVTQKGSNITGERLRFDFSHPEKLKKEQITAVEEIVNRVIAEDLPVRYEEMSLAEAKRRGAMGVFESKYGDKVKVYFIGPAGEEFSSEICGGPHVDHTGALGHFRIKKEESSSAGVRRIKAVFE